ANNGFDIVNLGIKVASDKLIEAVREYKPDIIGLSGLLVKSTAEMVNTAQDLTAVGITIPIMVGGAALTKRFTLNRIAPAYKGLVVYAKDAMSGLDLANRIQSSSGTDELKKEWASESEGARPAPKTPTIERERVVIDWSAKLHPAPDYIEHIEAGASLKEIWDMVNPKMLYNKHLGFRGNFFEKVAEGDERAVKLRDQVEAVKEEIVKHGYFSPQAIYRFFKAASESDEIAIIDGVTGRDVEHFRFPRQSAGARLCLSDFAKPRSMGLDDVAFFVT